MLDTLYTSPTYNSYATEAEIDPLMQHLEALNGTTPWTPLTTQQREAQIINATEWLNGMDWIGTKNPAIVVRTMDLPRDGLTYDDGTVIPNTQIPDGVQQAMACFIWGVMATGGVTATPTAGAVIEKKVGDVTVKYADSGTAGTIDMQDYSEGCASKYLDTAWYVSDAAYGIGSIGLRRGF